MQHRFQILLGLSLVVTATAAETLTALALESLHHLAEARGAITAKRFQPAWESIERARPSLHTLAQKNPDTLSRTEGLVVAAQKALEKKDYARADEALQNAEERVRANVLAETAE